MEDGCGFTASGVHVEFELGDAAQALAGESSRAQLPSASCQTADKAFRVLDESLTPKP